MTGVNSRSGLMDLLEAGHEGVSLSREELEKIAAWIDLLVPFCGDYMEANAWNGSEIEKYEHFSPDGLGNPSYDPM